MMRSDSKAKTIAGIVNSNGSVSRGKGFTATKLSTGTYQVRFDVQPKNILSVNLTPVSGTTAVIAVLDSATGPLGPANFHVKMYNTSLTLTDGLFSFTAIVTP